MRSVRFGLGQPLPEPAAALEGAVLARDVVVAGAHWSKGRRLSAADVSALAASGGSGERHAVAAVGTHEAAVVLIVADAGEVHEDDAAARLAAAVAGPGLVVRGPVDSRVDLLAAHAGLVRVRSSLVTRIDRIDGLAVFTVFDGQLVDAGALVASVKTGPHLVAEATLALGEAIAAQGGRVVEVRPYLRRRVAAIVKGSPALAARNRFDASVRARIEGLGSTLTSITYADDDVGAVTEAFRRAIRGREHADLVLTAGGGMTDPSDSFFGALAGLGGRVTSHGLPGHPGSMAWLGRCGRTVVLGLPSCSAYSNATAVDLLLPWLLAGEPADRRTVARLGHGGLLTHDMRFRFPAYARTLEAPEG
jgi:hypothetical protein